MKVWITKYALTQGIFSANGERCTSTGSPDMIEVRGKGLPGYYHGEGRDWHRSYEGALVRAEKMRAEKVVSMQKKISKLVNMKFTEPLPNGERQSG